MELKQMRKGEFTVTELQMVARVAYRAANGKQKKV